MKTYSATLIQQLQDCINEGKVQIETYKDYSFLKSLTSSGIKMTFYFDKDLDRKECILHLTEDMNAKFRYQWQEETAAGHFLINDYKNDVRDFIGNTLYHKVSYTINGKPFKALVRLLNEITGNVSEKKKMEIMVNFGDLTIDNNVFSVIKIVPDNKINSWSQEDVFSHLRPEIKKEYESQIIEDIMAQPEDKEEENLMSPLF